VLLAPSKPGIFALGEEIVAPAIDEVELRASSPVEASPAGLVDGNRRIEVSKRMLALFEVVETSDLGLALGRLFLPRSPLRERLESGRCFARFTVIEDTAERTSAYGALRNWMDQSAETASGLSLRDHNGPCGAGASAREASFEAETSAGEHVVSESQPSFSFPLGMEAPSRELNGKVADPAPLPSGF
jgi:hypothetical protein